MATRTAPGTPALVAAGAVLALYPLIRPWGDASADGEQAAFASVAWPLAHLAAVAGFALVAVGLLGLRDALAHSPGARAARGALGTWWAATALVLPYYGAETFALHTMGTRGTVDAALVEAIRMGPIQVTVFGVGLVAFAVAGVLAAVAVARSGLLPRWGGTVFALRAVPAAVLRRAGTPDRPRPAGGGRLHPARQGARPPGSAAHPRGHVRLTRTRPGP